MTLADRDVLDLAGIEALLADEVGAIRVREFIEPSAALRIAERLAQHPSRSMYRNTNELERVGQSHYETHNSDGSTDAEALDAYLALADRLMAEIGRACAPDESPFDQLWRMLQQTVGIERAVIGGKEMFAGIVRIFPEGSELLPHNDNFARDAPTVELASTLDGQLATNIYLETPAAGGELEIWRWRPTIAEFDRIRDTASEYGADRTRLPEPDLVIPVATGDLLVFDAAHLHAVRRQNKGRRIGLSCFLGYRHGRPLVCWS